MNSANVEHTGPPVTIRVAGCVMCESGTPGHRVFNIHASSDTEFRYSLCSGCLMRFASADKAATRALHDELLAKLWLIREAMPRRHSSSGVGY